MSREGFVPKAVMRAVIRGGVRPLLSPRVPWRTQRRVLDSLLGALAILPRGVTRSNANLGGRPTQVWTPEHAKPDSALLYLHGGAFTTGSPNTHRALAAHLAHRAGVVTHVLDYRLAPEHPFPAALDDATAAFEQLCAGLDPQRIVVAGDSAGAGLSVSLAIRLRDTGRPLPSALALICPWVDAADTHDGTADSDPLLRRSWLTASARAYGSGADLEDPLLSPINADLAGLPTMFVQASQHDLLNAQAYRLAESARAAGVSTTFEEAPGLWHDAHLNAGTVKDATLAVARVAEFVDQAIPR